MRHALLAHLCFLVVLLPSAAAGQSFTAFKSGEETTGMTKQCTYKFGETEYSKTVGAAELCPLSIKVAMVPAPSTQPAVAAPSTPARPAPPRQAPTLTVFKKSERTTGMSKQCTYAFGTTEYTRTIGAVELCPLSIKVTP